MEWISDFMPGMNLVKYIGWLEIYIIRVFPSHEMDDNIEFMKLVKVQ